MQPGGEAGEVFALLEGGGGCGGALLTLFGGVRDPWLARGLLAYHAGTGSARALDALARAPEPHARFLLNALAEQLAADEATRRSALATLAPLLARRPVWLPRLPQHALLPLLLRGARAEAEPAARLHALLALAALAALAPHALPPGPELAEALLTAAAGAEPHAALAAHALFAALYAAAPGPLVAALRRELSAAGAGAKRAAWARGLPRLLGGARLLPLLLLGAEGERASPPPALPPPPPAPPASPPAGAAALTARAVAELRPPAEPWFALAERCGADSAPHTPLPPEGALPGGGGEGGSPPEAAVEATPENTPAKETRAQFTFPSESGAARALTQLSAPPSPLRREAVAAGGAGEAAAGGLHAARLARVVRERAAPPASPVPFGAAAPPLAARPEPRPAAPRPAAHRALSPAFAREDREVWELSGGALPPPPPLLPPSPPAAARRRPRAPPARRARSCPPPAPPRAHAATQTVAAPPPPAHYLIHDLYRSLPEDAYKLWSEPESVSPSARLDAFLARLYEGGGGGGSGGAGDAAGQLALTHALLMFERWRREAQAERNRRLLGRVRQARALELSCAALRDRVRALTHDVEELRARKAAPPPVAPAAAPAPPDALAQLAAQLAAERLARDTAEALLHESERRNSVEAAELARLRGEAWEAARRGEGLARAQARLARTTELALRTRNELLLLKERERTLHRALQSAASCSSAGAGSGAALRAAAEDARVARDEAEAAAARAEQANARAHDLEAALANKESLVCELRRAARATAEEHGARLRALQDKYRALLHVQRRMELRQLECAARAVPPTPPPPPAPQDS